MKRILVFRACAIGDFVLNLPALQALQIVHPHARFTFVGYPATLELAREFVPVDAIHSIEVEPWHRLFYEPVDGLTFDSAIVWMKDPIVAENLRLSGLDEVLRADPFPSFGHAATHLLRTLKLPAPPLPDLWQPTSNEIIIHPGSGSPRKKWPYFSELTSRLSNNTPPDSGGVAAPAKRKPDRAQPQENAQTGRSLTRNITGEQPPRPPLLTNLDGSGTPPVSGGELLLLPELSRLLRHARAFIGNDSGITHLAAYLGVPTLALFGPTDPRMWGPVGRRSRIIWKSKLEDISVDEVLSYARRPA